MRLIIFSLLLLSIIVISPSLVNALTLISTPSSDLNRKVMQDIRDTVRDKRSEFKVRLQTIRDSAKRILVERIDTRMGSVNQRVTNRFLSVLDKLQSILNRLVGKAGDAKLKGIDTSQLDSAIGTAQVAIDNAKAVVASQAANLYAIEIASESALRVNVGSVVSQLRTDLRDVHKAIVDAKKAVGKVVMEFAKLRGGGLKEENTATGSSE